MSGSDDGGARQGTPPLGQSATTPPPVITVRSLLLDPALGIDWPLPSSGAVLSVKDRGLPPLSALDSPFDFDGCPLELAVA